MLACKAAFLRQIANISDEQTMRKTTLVNEFLRHVEEHPENTAITYLHDGEVDGPTSQWSYAELHARALRVAASLANAGARRGDRALLLHDRAPSFAEAFLGCLFAGVVPVPVVAPSSAKAARARARMQRIALSSGASLVLGTHAGAAGATALLAGPATISVLVTDDLVDVTRPAIEAIPTPDDIALLQYTSGSTSDPKGVIVSHENLAENQRILARSFHVTRETNFVSWLPIHHDMGLIGALLLALWNGTSITMMEPRHFIERPGRWLAAISGKAAIMSGAPNFAYALVLRKLDPEFASGLDLSGWETAFCGAEPIRFEVLRAFAERLAASGLRSRALLPCYGLAEATLFVCGVRPFVGVPKAEDAVVEGVMVCGSPEPEIEVAIVDPATRTRCAEATEGEIWVRGPNVARGYWRQPEASAHSFQARLANAGECARAWLRTGDLGRMYDGALHVTGRMEDLIIIRGRNIHPQDVELVVESCHPQIRPGCCAAFGVDDSDGNEGLGVAFELRDPIAAGEELEHAVASALVQALEVRPSLIAQLPPHGVHKTTSGKIQRKATRAAVEGAKLELLRLWRAEGERGPASAGPLAATIVDELEVWLAKRVGHRLPAGGRTLSLDELGVDSLDKVELIDWIDASFGHHLELAQLTGARSLIELAELIHRQASRPAEVARELPPAATTLEGQPEQALALPLVAWLDEQ
jgi:acyl-CoA synthetase (AMP-forming)/AMP-acid ligase II/acyl carrier protein